MLEITANDIARLNDEQLRAVVARLCEAELRSRGLSASHVTWGGNQTAVDGGIDVRVALPPTTLIDGFVPRPMTGFQVKAQDMPAGEITDEMRPKGAIRPSIQDVAGQSGAYIIVSSHGSTADSPLTNRRAAMRDAVADVQNADALFLDFYDRTRIETWVRSHEGLIPWVRTLVGRPIPGWQSYGAWACDPAGEAAKYLFDEKLRLSPANPQTDQGLTALQGVQQLRDVLRQPRHVVRLVGLSGVGKTRLVQAIFEERVGEASLDPSLALYTNMADEPDPQPIAMASNLVAGETRAVLVIDNCRPELHQRLSEVCRQDRSRVSVITVEYDIREDEPEGTEVFRLESSSPELIDRLVRRRYPKISQIDRHTIAEFSDGNARIAIALADNVEQNATITGLADQRLFQRLFQQAHGHDESLYLIAQACALVYSFEGNDISESDGAEIVRLGRLISKTQLEVYRGVAELKRRGLVQQRSGWRAVLPHAIANRLAAAALQNIPYAQIEQQLLTVGAERLMRSFSRRLGYLYTSPEAAKIVTNWLAVGGLLGSVASFNDLGWAMFKNVAPAAPANTLATLERALLGPEGDAVANQSTHYCDLLRSLAYDPALFGRAVALLVKVATSEDLNERTHSARIFASLFHLILSGTRATIEQRAAIIGSLLRAPDEKQRTLGVLGLNALLEAQHFQSMSNFDFGAQSRDFGYWPRTNEERQHWFRSALRLVETFACADEPVAPYVRAALAENFRGLWLGSGSQDEIVRVCAAIGKQRFWPEAWLAVRQAIDLDGNGLEAECLTKLVGLETMLCPKGLVQKVRAVVFSTRLHGVDLDDFEDHSSEDTGTRIARTEALAQDLGKEVAAEPEILAELLPEIVSSDGRLESFGQGLIATAGDARELWQRLVDALTATAEADRKPEVLFGVLRQLRAMDPELASSLLDEAVEHYTLGGIYPFLQVAVNLDAQDVARLKRSVALGRAPAGMYKYLANDRATHPISPQDLQELLLAIAALPFGQDVAINILQVRLRSDKKRKQEPVPEFVETACALLQSLTFSKGNDHRDYVLGEIAASCFRGGKEAPVVFGHCQRLKSAVAEYETSAYNHDDLLIGLFTAQPVAALNGLCGGDKKELELGIRVLRDAGIRRHPLEIVSDDELVKWCDQDPLLRYPAMAGAITVAKRAGENAPPGWTSVALRFLERAPDPSAVLRIFTSHFSPSHWSGSLAAVMESNAVLLDQLELYPALNDAVSEEKERLRQWIAEERRLETLWDRERDERFE